MSKKALKGWGPRERTDKRTGAKIWVVDYRDLGGKRHQLRYMTQKDAVAKWQTIQSDLGRGRHVAPTQSVILNEAAEHYYESLQLSGAARGTIDGRKYAYDKHIRRYLGGVRVSKLTAQIVQQHLRDRQKNGVSVKRIGVIKVTLSAILTEAVVRGTAGFNAAAAIRRKRTRRARVAEKQALQCKLIEKSVVAQLVETAARTGRYAMAIRHDGTIPGTNGRQLSHMINASMEVVDIVRVEGGEAWGSEAYARSLVELRERWNGEDHILIRSYCIEDWIQPFIITQSFAGLRVGEMRALGWEDIDWGGRIRVRRAADQFRQIGPVKSPAALRDLPMGDVTRESLRQLWVNRGRPPRGLVFPGHRGTVQSRQTIIGTQYHPLWLLMNLRNDEGKLVYHSFHPLRHFCVSLWIEQGKTLLDVQKWVGHERIETTMDIYGHLFDAREALRANISDAERAVLGEGFRPLRRLNLISS